VTADAGSGCEVNASVDVLVFPVPDVAISASATEVKSGTEVTLTASGALTYDWMADPTLSTTLGEVTTATPTETTLYKVTGTSADDCVSEAEITISVVEVVGQLDIDPMTSFSPNGDSIDDLFVIEGLENYTNCTVTVFTRNGRKVFEKKSYTNDWDAVENGKILPAGVYFFLVTCENTESNYKGSVLVAR
jgi:gliding motility-associated-like protein